MLILLLAEIQVRRLMPPSNLDTKLLAIISVLVQIKQTRWVHIFIILECEAVSPLLPGIMLS